MVDGEIGRRRRTGAPGEREGQRGRGEAGDGRTAGAARTGAELLLARAMVAVYLVGALVSMEGIDELVRLVRNLGVDALVAGREGAPFDDEGVDRARSTGILTVRGTGYIPSLVGAGDEAGR